MLNFKTTLSQYIKFLKLSGFYKKKNILKYELSIEKLQNWKKSDFNHLLQWYLDIKKKK